MSHKTTANKPRVFAAATAALGVAGLIIVPAPAHALPACVQFGFPGDVNLIQNDGWSVTFSSTGSNASGPAQASHSGGGKLTGTVAGGIEGKKINVVTTWNNGSRGLYTGTVGDDYHMSGTTTDIGEGHAFGPKVPYRSQFPISCLTTPDPPQANPGAPSKTAFVTTPPEYDSVDVYDVQGGNGNVIGTVAKDKGVQVNADCQPETWCLIRGAAVPSGQGWIWGHLRFE
jgi:hypothetical protein